MTSMLRSSGATVLLFLLLTGGSFAQNGSSIAGDVFVCTQSTVDNEVIEKLKGTAIEALKGTIAAKDMLLARANNTEKELRLRIDTLVQERNAACPQNESVVDAQLVQFSSLAELKFERAASGGWLTDTFIINKNDGADTKWYLDIVTNIQGYTYVHLISRNIRDYIVDAKIRVLGKILWLQSTRIFWKELSSTQNWARMKLMSYNSFANMTGNLETIKVQIGLIIYD